VALQKKQQHRVPNRLSAQWGSQDVSWMCPQRKEDASWDDLELKELLPEQSVVYYYEQCHERPTLAH